MYNRLSLVYCTEPDRIVGQLMADFSQWIENVQ